MASQVIDIGSTAAALEIGGTTVTAGEGRLTTDQVQLAAVDGTLTDGPVRAQVRTLLTDLGLFRFTVDHQTYNGSQVKSVVRDVTDIEGGCVTTR